ncbi:delta-6 fatty acid desaturase [Gilbertella persicaria]|uniref:delta-6 fatty acid desaturase n=1 Tax=Gilbertella persicaria TaxID=101096 RepID=UPI00221F6DCE|nr:delta-6 fatty acid desaturase [Gilbertella persicaria]KAI8071120.1 delta-6 fatty acid desaturase [Gilbertella persicaria]
MENKVGSTVPYFFTRAELAQIHQDVLDNKPNAKKLIVVENKVYDITEFIVDHPGGERVIKTQVGRDATDVFKEMHPPSAYELLANLYVGDVEPKMMKNSKAAAFAQEIRDLRLRLEKEGLFEASTSYYVYKVLSTVLVCVVGLVILQLWGKTSTLAVVISAVIVGLFWQQCGWLAHDFAHYQVIKDPHLNNLFLHQCVGEDPDIDTAPILLWDEFAAANFYGSLSNSGYDKFLAEHVLPFQTRYYFFILAFARTSWAFQSLKYSFKNESLTKSKVLSWCERLFLMIHWVFFSSCALAWIDSWRNVALFFIISQMTAGYLLALVFAMNHNGMPILSSAQASATEFYELQVITGRDVTSTAFGDWLMGGLNYQIEHHVFPEMPRHQLPLVKPMVKQLAQKYDIRYHDTSFLGGTFEVLKTLDIIQRLSLRLSKKVY